MGVVRLSLCWIGRHGSTCHCVGLEAWQYLSLRWIGRHGSTLSLRWGLHFNIKPRGSTSASDRTAVPLLSEAQTERLLEVGAIARDLALSATLVKSP